MRWLQGRINKRPFICSPPPRSLRDQPRSHATFVLCALGQLSSSSSKCLRGKFSSSCSEKGSPIAELRRDTVSVSKLTSVPYQRPPPQLFSVMPLAAFCHLARPLEVTLLLVRPGTHLLEMDRFNFQELMRCCRAVQCCLLRPLKHCCFLSCLALFLPFLANGPNYARNDALGRAVDLQTKTSFLLRGENGMMPKIQRPFSCIIKVIRWL